MKKKFKSIIRISITLFVILTISFIMFFYKIIFQEGNPIFVGIGIIKLEILNKNYVSIGDNKFVAKNNKLDLFIEENGYILKDVMGAGKFLQNVLGENIILTTRKFTKNYDIYVFGK